MNEKDTQTKEQASEETEGGSETQTSEDNGTTSPKDATFELDKIYQVPGRPELKLTGAQLRDAVGRAELAQKFQSSVDKLTSEKQSVEQQLGEAQARLKAMEEDNRLVEKLESMGLLGTKPAASDETRRTTDWMEEEEEPETLSAKEVAKIVRDVTTQNDDERIKIIEDRILGRVNEGIEQEREAEERLRQYEKFRDADSRTRRAALRREYPSLADDRIENIAILLEASQKSWNEANKDAAMGKDETAIPKAEESSAYLYRAAKEMATAMNDQKTADDEKEYEQLLETGDFVPVPKELEEKAREPILDSKKAKARNQSIVEHLAEKAEAKFRAKLARGS